MSVRSRDGLVPVVGLALFVLLAWVYGRNTPLLETPDESSHFSVVSYIASQKRLPPPPTRPLTGPVPEVSPGIPSYYAPPLYYALAGLLIQGLDTSGFYSAVIPNPTFSLGWGLSIGKDLSSTNMYVHTAGQRPPPAEWAVALQRVRLFSLFLGAATVLGAYFLARQLWPSPADRPWRWVALALVAFNPTFIYISNGVSNDGLLIALSTWSIALMAGLLSSGPAAERRLFGWRDALLAFLLGLAILTKQSGLLLLPLVAFAMAFKNRTRGWPGRYLAARLLLTGLIVVALGGWWYFYTGLRYGDWLALSAHQPLAPAASSVDRLFFLGQQGWGAFKSYWAAFGWATIFVHPAWYVFFGLVTLGGLLGWSRRRRVTRPRAQSLFLLPWAAVALNGVMLLGWLWRTAAPYGRLLFPAMAPLACLLVEGWRRWLSGSQLGRPFLAKLWQIAIVAPILTLAIAAPAAYLRPALAAPLAAADDLTDLEAAQVTYDAAFELLGYRYTPESPEPGEAVDVTLYWRLIGEPAQPSDHLVFIQLSPHDPQRQVASASDLLGTPRYPTSVWQAGDMVKQSFRLDVPEWAPAPTLYWFNVGLTPGPSLAPLPVAVNGQSVPESFARLGPFRMAPGARTQPGPSSETRYDFGAAIRLEGYDVARTLDGESLVATLHWHALAPPPEDWTVFVHLLDAGGRKLGQHDSPPLLGGYPTSWWEPGDRVQDPHPLDVSPEALRPGSTLLVGLYHLVTGERVPVVDGQEKLLTDAAVRLAAVVGGDG